MADHAGLADRRDLAQWADSVEAESKFPRLVRRLILETGKDLTALGMPVGEGVRTGGWDGTVSATTATHKIPQGVSVWEVSVDSSPGVKAQKDYVKRVTAPDGLSTSDVTYVATILRPWKKRDEWAQQRTNEGRWKKVVAYGLDDIDVWLDDAPATRVWFSEEIGLRPTGLKSAERWWASWSSQTRPALSPAVPLAGRTREAADLRQFIDESGGGVLTVGGASADEATAFVVAFAQSEANAGRGEIFSRTVVVDDLAALRRLAGHQRPLVLILSDPALANDLAPDNKHQVIVPLAESHDVDLRLGRLDAAKVASALVDLGQSQRDSDQGGRLARRSLTALRRKLAVNPALHRPPWAAPPTSREVRSILLVGAWRDDNENDREIVAKLVGTDYEQVLDHAAGLEAESDPFVSRVGDLWEVVSVEDAWILLIQRLSVDDIKRFEISALAVLGEADPATDLPLDQRWMAGVMGKTARHSPSLRRGLARSLALLGAYGSDTHISTSGTAADWASGIVRQLLDQANADVPGGMWQSLSGLLPLLAEAAPEVFLAAVDAGVSGASPVLRHLFTDAKGSASMTTQAYHSGLLWALETLAWNPDYVGTVTDLLARLDAIDPGGTYANRPLESLRKIFCSWSPQTTASLKQRLSAIDGLRTRYPDCAWHVLLSMIPTSHDVLFPSSEPNYREWKPDKVTVLRSDVLEVVQQTVERLITDAASSADRWMELVSLLDDLPPTDRDRLLARLDVIADNRDAIDGNADELWRALTGLIGRHREFPDAQWVLPDDALDAMQQVADKLAPTDEREKGRSLFDDWHPFVGSGVPRSDYAEREREVTRLRAEAVAAVERVQGFEAVRQLALEAKLPWAVGVALADATADKYDAQVVRLLSPEPSQLAQFADAYIARRFEASGWEALDALRDQVGSDLTDDQVALLVLASRDHPRSWECVADLGSTVERAYWRFFGYLGLGEFQHVEFVFEQLMKARRPAAALDFMQIYGRADWTPVRADLIAKALELIVEPNAELEPNDRGLLSRMDVQGLFDVLELHRDAIGAERLANLEWAYLPAFGLDATAPTLESIMATSPSLFVDVVSIVYRARKEESEQADEEESPGDADMESAETEELSDEDRQNREHRVGNAYRLLSNWSVVPGARDGVLDAVALNDWYDAARAKLEDARRLSVGLHHIGQVLVGAPADPGEPWPPLVVRDLLERVRDIELERGVFLGLVNRRGVTTRGLENGGVQELDEATRFRREADAYAAQWPRTAAILRQVAKSLENDARRNEDEAERRRQGLD